MSINKVQGTGFAQVANAALRDKRLSFKARGVLAMVLSYSGEWDAPRDWLEQQSDKDGRDAIQSALNELTDLGYRKVVRSQKPDGTWLTEAHWFQTPDESTEGRVSRPSEKPAVGEPVPPPEHQNQNTKTSPSATPPIPVMEGDTHSFALQLVTAPVESGTDPFDTFWAAYPKKVDKGAARRMWKSALKKAPPATIIAGAKRYAEERREQDRKYTKNPSTWLYAEAWGNEAGPAVRPGTTRDMSALWIKQDFGNPLEGIAP